MNYISWDYRGISFFKEEIIDFSDEKINIYPSIKDFQQTGFYTAKIRNQLCNYLESCIAIVSTSYIRRNAYTYESTFSLTYFTDGEFIFTNLLQEYIRHENFVLPQKWYELIKARNYLNEDFALDYEKISSGQIDVFQNFEKHFNEPSIVRKVIL